MALALRVLCSSICPSWLPCLALGNGYFLCRGDHVYLSSVHKAIS